jgi:hypothetical protein
MNFIKDKHHKDYCDDPYRVLAEPIITSTLKIKFGYKQIMSSFHPSYLDGIPVPIKPGYSHIQVEVPVNYSNYSSSSLAGGNFHSTVDIDWVNSNIEYISKLPIEDKFTIYSYTRRGDVIVNAFLRENEDELDEIIMIYIRKMKYKEDEYMPLFFQIIKNLKEATKDYTLTPMDIFAPKRTGLKPSDFKTFVKTLKKESKKNSFEKLYRFFIDNQYGDKPFNMFSRMFYVKCIKSYADDLSRIINNSPPIKNTTIVYRGVKTKYYIDNAVNNTFKSSTFVSTSYSPEKAMNFAYGMDIHKSECCFKKIILGPGTKALFMEAITAVDGEFELLLNKDTEFAIIEDKDEEYFLTLEYDYNALCTKTRNIDKKHTTTMQVINKGDKLPKKQVPLKKVRILFTE